MSCGEALARQISRQKAKEKSRGISKKKNAPKVKGIDISYSVSDSGKKEAKLTKADLE